MEQPCVRIRLARVLKDHREIVSRVLAREEYRRPAEDNDLRMIQSRIDRNPVERARDALVQFNAAVVRFEGISTKSAPISG